MDEIEWHRSIQSHAGLRNAAEAKRALRSTLGAIRCSMDDASAREIVELLPAPWRSIFARVAPVRVHGERDFYAEVERRERVGPGFAKEHAQSVLQTLARELEPDLVERLRSIVPADVAALLRSPRPFPEPPPHVHEHGVPPPRVDRTLAGGAPHASESIAEARHALAHRDSVARSEAPHSGRMIATARSDRPSAADETFASAREPRRTKRH